MPKQVGYDPLEKDPNYTYRVLSNNAYWRDIKSSELQLYHQGAERESELVSKNPVTGKFENIPFNITRSHNNYLEGFHQDDEGNPKTIIYKRKHERTENSTLMQSFLMASV